MSPHNNTDSYSNSNGNSNPVSNAVEIPVPGMQKATLLFCVFTSGLLAVFAWLMTEINHSPWGLVGAAVVVLTLTAQQVMRKPQSAVVDASGIIESSRGAFNLSSGASNLSRGAA